MTILKIEWIMELEDKPPVSLKGELRLKSLSRLDTF